MARETPEPPAAARRTTRQGAQPLVSVVTPTRNRRPFIAQLLRCFRHQDYPAERMELVIVDDGEDLVGDLLDGLPNVRYVHVEGPLAIGRKRNLLLALAHAVNTVSKAALRLRPMPYAITDIVDCPESLRFYLEELPRLQAGHG